MKFILAISGGIDSVVLLDDFDAKHHGEYAVAHFDHGMRPSASTDAEFVRKKAEQLGARFYLDEGHLGASASEAEARDARYKFLREVAKKEGGEIVTAHHLNDLAETIAINLLRGTGWRGLAPFSNDILRPFVFGENALTKFDIYKIASEKGLSFRQDPTNNEDKYLRNRLRERIFESFSASDYSKLAGLFGKQTKIRKEVEKLVVEILPEDGHFKRSWFFELDDDIAMEILRAGLARAGASLTRPQLMDFLRAIREYMPGKKFNLPGGKLVTLHKDFFVL